MFRKNWVYFCGNCNRFVLQKYNNNNGRYYCCLCGTIDPWQQMCILHIHNNIVNHYFWTKCISCGKITLCKISSHFTICKCGSIPQHITFKTTLICA